MHKYIRVPDNVLPKAGTGIQGGGGGDKVAARDGRRVSWSTVDVDAVPCHGPHALIGGARAREQRVSCG